MSHMGFVRAEGTSMVDGHGRELRLRGVGLGNWMLPEGYMWKFTGSRADRPRRIEALIDDLVGTDLAHEFWNTFYDRYITEADIEEIARLGFNSVRLPINARFIWYENTLQDYKEHNLKRIDQLIDWCRTYQLYVILDLHGAPGGQTGANIDDSPSDYPDLFTSAANQEATVLLWTMLANRYKDNTTVAGYDLLNEPLSPAFGKQYHAELLRMYKLITSEIRKVDLNHMIIVEGAVWATDWSIFTEKFDSNMVFQFHKYWSPPDTPSIQGYLDKRMELNAPIWMGEGGENSPEWLLGCFQLYENHEVGWNFWPWKKLDTTSSPYSIPAPDGWDEILSYVDGGTKPDRQTSVSVLWEYLDNIQLTNCIYREDIVNSLFTTVDTSLHIPAVYFGFRGEGVSYETSVSNTHPFRSGDGPQIENLGGTQAKLPDYWSGDSELPENQLCVVLSQGDWVRYEVTCTDKKAYRIRLRVRSDKGRARLLIETGEPHMQGLTVEIDEQDWNEVDMSEPVILSDGRQSITLKGLDGELRVHWLEIRT